MTISCGKCHGTFASAEAFRKHKRSCAKLR
jgi:hypothetical protein